MDINDLTIVLASYDQRIALSAAGNLAAVPEPNARWLSWPQQSLAWSFTASWWGFRSRQPRPARPQALNRG